MKKRFLRIAPLFLLLLHIISPVRAKELFYSSAQASQLSKTTFNQGDIIILENGSWHDKVISVKGKGTADNPIIVKARTAGEVILSGKSTLTIDGEYIEVSGVLFEGNSSAEKNHIVTFSKQSSYCRFTNSAIVNYNPKDSASWKSTDNKWISINGKNNRVDHCYFEGKANIGTLMVVWLVDGQAACHQIDNNHFYNRSPLLDDRGKEINGQETLRIGDSSTSMTTASCIVENNFFEACDGEIEIISNKSCGNIYRNNVFYNNNGTLTLRHGNSCEVYNNYFLGNNQERSGGLRVIGANHKIYNNYFQDIMNSGYRSALCLVNGKENSALNEYFQVKNALIVFNTFYNCKNAFTIGYDGGKDLAPVSTTIAHNIVFAREKKQNGVNITNTESEITWKNNLLYKGRFYNFSPDESQFKNIETNPDFEPTHPTYEIYQPTSRSILADQYKTTDYPEIEWDIQGRARPEKRTIGAFEISNQPLIDMPTPQTIGCSFINKENSGISAIPYKKKENLIENLYVENDQLIIITIEEKLNLKIFNTNGQLKAIPSALKIEGGYSFQLPKLLSGLYLFSFGNGYNGETRQLILTHN